MYRYPLTLLFSCLLLCAQSQTAASYDFFTSQETYSSISGFGTPATINGDDLFQTSIQLGFSFPYCGVQYPVTYASSNGYIQLTNILPSSGAPSASNSTASLSLLNFGKGIICPFWDDLDGTGRESYYTTVGKSPYRVFIFEWMNYGLYGGLSGATLDTLNFQVKLYETTGMIQFCYGTHNNPALSATMAIVNSTTDYQTLDNPGTSPTPSASTFTTNIGSLPADGQVYTWMMGPVAVQENSSYEEIILWPNPSSTGIHMRSADIITSLDIFNEYGSLVHSSRPMTTLFSLSGLAPGCYVINTEVGGKMITRRFVAL